MASKREPQDSKIKERYKTAKADLPTEQVHAKRISLIEDEFVKFVKFNRDIIEDGPAKTRLFQLFDAVRKTVRAAVCRPDKDPSPSRKAVKRAQAAKPKPAPVPEPTAEPSQPPAKKRRYGFRKAADASIIPAFPGVPDAAPLTPALDPILPTTLTAEIKALPADAHQEVPGVPPADVAANNFLPLDQIPGFAINDGASQ